MIHFYLWVSVFVCMCVCVCVCEMFWMLLQLQACKLSDQIRFILFDFTKWGCIIGGVCVPCKLYFLACQVRVISYFRWLRSLLTDSLVCWFHNSLCLTITWWWENINVLNAFCFFCYAVGVSFPQLKPEFSNIYNYIHSVSCFCCWLCFLG